MKIWSDHINILWEAYLIDENAGNVTQTREDLAKAIYKPMFIWLPQVLTVQQLLPALLKNDLTVDQISSTICNEVILILLSVKPEMKSPDNYLFTLIKRQALAILEKFEIGNQRFEQLAKVNPIYTYTQVELKNLDHFKEVRRKKIENFLQNELIRPLSAYEIEVFFQRYLSYDTGFKEWADVAASLGNSIDSVKAAHQDLKIKVNEDERNYTRLAELLKIR